MKPLWRPLDADCLLDPYPMYKSLRENDPVHQAQTGEWIISRYEDVKAILRNNDFLVGNRLQWLSKGVGYFNDKSISFHHIEEAIGDFILFLNPPDHTRIRKFIMKAWNTDEVDQIITDNLEKLISELPGKSFDMISQISNPLPAMTISRLLGIPIEDHTYLKEISRNLIKSLDLYVTLRDIQRIDNAASRFLNYFKQLVSAKRAHPDEKIISRLIDLNNEDGTLSEKELISTCILLFVAGEETSLGLTGTGIMNLIKQQERWEELRSNVQLLPTAIEELLRYDAPAQFVGRIAANEIELGGKIIEKSSTLTLCIGSANRDPDQFESPDELLLSRNPNRHLSFGGGAHFCLGDWLAKTQARHAIQALQSRFKTLRILDEVPQWNGNLSVRCLKSLHVAVRD